MKPFATRRALNQSTEPSALRLIVKTHLHPTTLAACTGECRTQVWLRSCALISSHIAFLHLGSFNASATDVGILSVAGTTTAERLSLSTGLRFRVDALCGWCWTGFGAAGGASVEGMIVGCVDCSGGGIGGAAAAVGVVVVGAEFGGCKTGTGAVDGGAGAVDGGAGAVDGGA